jgi:hypothetical protein
MSQFPQGMHSLVVSELLQQHILGSNTKRKRKSLLLNRKGPSSRLQLAKTYRDPNMNTIIILYRQILTEMATQNELRVITRSPLHLFLE